MIVEFIGSTGAGKTTLIREVQRKLAPTTRVTTSFELVAAPWGLRGVTHSTAKNLIQELAGFPFFLCSLNRHKAFLAFALRMLARQGELSIFTLNNLRSLERKIGVYEILRRDRRERIVLVDEGTVLSAHNMFVFTSAVYSPEEVAGFAELVPLPDRIVYIKAPVEVLVQRSLLRADPPREMRTKDPDMMERNICRAVRMFDQLATAENIRSRLLTVENTASHLVDREALVDEIVRFILRHEYEPATEYN